MPPFSSSSCAAAGSHRLGRTATHRSSHTIAQSFCSLRTGWFVVFKLEVEMFQLLILENLCGILWAEKGHYFYDGISLPLRFCEGKLPCWSEIPGWILNHFQFHIIPLFCDLLLHLHCLTGDSAGFGRRFFVSYSEKKNHHKTPNCRFFNISNENKHKGDKKRWIILNHFCTKCSAIDC